MPSPHPEDSWNRGTPYDLYVGRWSRLIADEFLGWLNLPPSLRWLATPFKDFDDYWTPFLGGQGPATAYAMALDEASRTRLRDRIRERLPVDRDGSIALVARAWAIRGREPN